jgi:hypothetical protein
VWVTIGIVERERVQGSELVGEEKPRNLLGIHSIQSSVGYSGHSREREAGRGEVGDRGSGQKKSLRAKKKFNS